MSLDLENSLGGWDRTFLDLSSKLAEPFCSVYGRLAYRLAAPLEPGKFENCATRAKEISARVLIGLGVIIGAFLLCALPVPFLSIVVLLGVSCKVLRAIGFALQKGGYTHVRGQAPEKELDSQSPQAKIMTWNICGVGGGMSKSAGGVVHWQYRLDSIVKKIKEEDPDVLVLQEIYDTALSEALIERLQSEYAHFFTHLGPNVWGSVGGCMVLSKCAVHSFSNTSFANNTWSVARGFAALEIKASPKEALPCARIIGTHLHFGEGVENQKMKMEQVAQIIHHVARQTLALLTVLAGDLNIERDEPEGAVLSDFLHHGYQGAEPTCTNRLAAQWDGKERSRWEERIDYLSLFKNSIPNAIDVGVTLEDGHLVEAYDKTHNTKTALSDHHGLSVTIKGLRRNS